MGNFANKTVLVTGGASGIGKKTALAFATAGANIVILDISDQGEATRDHIKQHHQDALFIKADITKFEEHQKAIAAAIKRYGRLDCACNNAGIEQTPAPLTQVEENIWNRIMDINVKGIWLGMKAQIPQMLNQGFGTIVNTASTVGVAPVENVAVYGASKAAVINLTKTAALENAAHGLRINAIAPGFTLTDMSKRLEKGDPAIEEKITNSIPMKRGAKPEEIANAIVWLCSDQASYITGHCLVVDGGWTI